METIFHNDPRIEEWVNQITEKIFTVCLLTGVDSDAEFQKGCLIVTKIASLLLGFSSFPSEYLEDGLRQLLEQQLPDKRVINNFPTFYDTMNKMLQEGISKVIDSQKIEADNTREDVTECDTEDINEEVKEEVLEECEIENPLKETDIVDVGFLIEPIGISSQVSEQAERLKHILSFIFPNKNVTWNCNLMGQMFLAQVDDILIYLQDHNHPLNLQIYNREGWKVVICNTEDLKYPRRLERRIRQILRIGKKS